MGPEHPFGRKNDKYKRSQVQRSLLCAKNRQKAWLEELREQSESRQELDHAGCPGLGKRLHVSLRATGTHGGLREGEYVLYSPSKVITWKRKCVGEEVVAGDQSEVAPGPGER